MSVNDKNPNKQSDARLGRRHAIGGISILVKSLSHSWVVPCGYCGLLACYISYSLVYRVRVPVRLGASSLRCGMAGAMGELGLGAAGLILWLQDVKGLCGR